MTALQLLRGPCLSFFLLLSIIVAPKGADTLTLRGSASNMVATPEMNAYTSCDNATVLQMDYTVEGRELKANYACYQYDRDDCCEHVDGRGWSSYGGQPCVPAASGQR